MNKFCRSITTIVFKFSLAPERASRFFSLSLQTHLQTPLSQTIQQQHKKHMKTFEQKGALLMGYQQKTQQIQKKNQNAKFFYYFQSPNQVEAYQFMKSGPFKNYVQSYVIQEITMQPRTRLKELAPRNLRE